MKKVKELLDNVDKILCQLGKQYKSGQHTLIVKALSDLRKVKEELIEIKER